MSSDDEFYSEDVEDDTSEFDSDTENVETEDQDEDVVRVLTYSDIREVMNEKIEEVREILEVNNGVCRVLLQKYSWDKTILLEKFYEDPNFIVNSKIALRASDSSESSNGECDICCDTAPLVGLSCNHTACKECWRAYLTEKINEKKCEIQCMASDCELIIDDDKIQEYLSSDTTVISAFQQLTVDEYVETNHFLTQCSCGMVVKSSRSDAHLVVCSCGIRFCFSCRNDSHEPVNCRLLKLWEKKCVGVKNKTAASADGYSSDKETFNWILSNTKDCPKCVTSIEKNGGCNRITCRSKTCRFEFCWLCMREWSVHGYSSCNTFNAKDEKNRVDSRAELHRFLFFYNRFKSHEQSLELEKKLVKTVNAKMEEMQQKGIGWADVLFLRKSVNILAECRRTLMFTYIFAFYLERNNQAIMFDGNQKDLEMAVEQLSGLLEQEMETNDLRVLIQKTQDKSRYVEYRRKVLLDHCTEGMEQDAWVYNA
ncbi:hypothetical protein GCK72_009223 [Caenorhabditis remanei]|uniref:RBR-type E3 ubiquitin transferase n=1 Tax=Caenorhabditis remanei TaxID=31234 RepID=A0A6A5GZM6_CAERE|nr:hypothetical protein GCK72_009223 [Caenorhabditis remanei]KAF1760970.1 hypothetical protein GCK72_009223 [Caenorhabditis remanei]